MDPTILAELRPKKNQYFDQEQKCKEQTRAKKNE